MSVNKFFKELDKKIQVFGLSSNLFFICGVVLLLIAVFDKVDNLILKGVALFGGLVLVIFAGSHMASKQVLVSTRSLARLLVEEGNKKKISRGKRK